MKLDFKVKVLIYSSVRINLTCKNADNRVLIHLAKLI